jgi:predicted enzyme related to lactoylglutathione lyase
MATIEGPDFVALQVRDLAAAARFYEEVVGLERAPQSPPDAVVFATRPIAFALRTPLPGVELDAGQPGLGVALWLKADDAPALLAQLQERGVPIARPLAPSPFGLTFVFRDPDGYQITVHDRG